MLLRQTVVPRLLWLAVLVAMGTSQAPGDEDSLCNPSTSGVLIDSNNYMNLDGIWTIDGGGDGNMWMVSSDSSQCDTQYEYCGGAATDNMDLLTTQNIDPTSAGGAQLTYTLDYTTFDCPENSGSNDFIRISICLTSSPGCTDMIDIPITCNNSSTSMSATRSPPTGTFNLRIFGNFSDGVCARITRLQVTFALQPCSEITNDFATYPMTNDNMTATGNCVDNAEAVGGATLQAVCNDGMFNFSSAGGCQCSAGFEPSGQMCIACAEDYFLSSGSSCVQCPFQSSSSGVNTNTFCTCNTGYVTGSDPPMTTTMGNPGCNGCAAGHYQMSGGANDPVCVMCPDNSNREAGTSPTVCPCNEGFSRRDNSDSDADCIATVGFTETAVTFSESQSSVQVQVDISAADDVTVAVATPPDLTVDPTSVQFTSGGSTTQTLTLSHSLMDTVALEDDRTFTVTLSSSDDVILVNQSLQVTITDDDVVNVGFTMDAVSFSENMGTGMVTIQRSTDIARDVVVRVTGGTPPDRINFSPGQMLTFEPSTGTTLSVDFDINDNVMDEGPSTYTMMLELVEPSAVQVGGGSLSNSITITITDDDEVATVGFTQESLTVGESDGTATITIRRSTDIVTNVVLRITGEETERAELLTSEVTFVPGGPDSMTVTVNIANNIEDDGDFVYQLTLEVMAPQNDPRIRLGDGSSFFESISITISDDDEVATVGFTQESLTVGESDGTATITIRRSTDIVTNVVLRITGEETERAELLTSEVTFVPGPPDSMAVTVNITDNIEDDGDFVYQLTLQVEAPQNDPRIRLGDGSSLFDSISITISDDDEEESASDGFPVAGAVGAAVGGVVIAILLVGICIICVLFFRFRVNRRGFYPTYEDKASAPTMLRYSASLRSISSQTVMPVDGKPVTKENEFYV